MALIIRLMLLAIPLLICFLFVDSQDLNHPKVCIRLPYHPLNIMKRLFCFRTTRVWPKLILYNMKVSYFYLLWMVFSSLLTKGLAKLCGSFAMVNNSYLFILLYYVIYYIILLLLDPPVKVPSNIKDALTYVLIQSFCYYYF